MDTSNSADRSADVAAMLQAMDAFAVKTRRWIDENSEALAAIGRALRADHRPPG